MQSKMHHQDSETKSFIIYKKDELFSQLLNLISGRESKITDLTPEEREEFHEVAVLRMQMELERVRAGLPSLDPRLDMESEIKLMGD